MTQGDRLSRLSQCFRKRDQSVIGKQGDRRGPWTRFMLEDIGERLAGALKSRGNRRWEKSDHSAMMQDGIMSRSRVRNGMVEAVNSCIVQSDFTGSWRWKFSHTQS